MQERKNIHNGPHNDVTNVPLSTRSGALQNGTIFQVPGLIESIESTTLGVNSDGGGPHIDADPHRHAFCGHAPMHTNRLGHRGIDYTMILGEGQSYTDMFHLNCGSGACHCNKDIVPELGPGNTIAVCPPKGVWIGRITVCQVVIRHPTCASNTKHHANQTPRH